MHAKRGVLINNQNSQPLELKIDGLVYILHDNRIFVFKCSEENNATAGTAVELQTSSGIQNIVLNILASAKIRSVSMLYIVFRLLDNTALIVIIVLSLLNGILSFPSGSDYALITAIGVEGFYDVMVNLNKYWILQRLSFNIGIALFVVYFSIVYRKHVTGEIEYSDSVLIFWVLVARLVAFILEEMIDVGVDFLVHDMLVDIQELMKANPAQAANATDGEANETPVNFQAANAPNATNGEGTRLFQRCARLLIG